MLPSSNKPSDIRLRNVHISQLRNYRLPASAVVSILHRISGLLLFLALPFLAYLLSLSLTSEISYARLRDVMAHPVVTLIVIVLLWGFTHHLLAGVRFLFLDMHKGVRKESSRKSSKWVLSLSLIVTAALAWIIAV